jgi:hypothetical protein
MSSQALKEQGNEQFKNKNYREALNLYTKAIGILSYNIILRN